VGFAVFVMGAQDLVDPPLIALTERFEPVDES
jgi:hypothetical protein